MGWQGVESIMLLVYEIKIKPLAKRKKGIETKPIIRTT